MTFELLATDPRSAVVDGDIMPLDPSDIDRVDPLTDEERYELALAEDAERQGAINDIRKNRNFQPRNAAIAKAGDFVAKACRSDGAAHLHASGVDTTDIRGAADADGREVVERTRAINLGEQACRLCPLAEHCDLNGGFIPLIHVSSTQRAVIDDARTKRDRLRNRVKHEKFTENNHFCETNMHPDRLEKDVA